MNVVLIPCGATEWHDAGRLLGRVELELCDTAEAQCARWLESLRPLELKKLFVAPDSASRATGKLIGHELGLSAKPVDDLVEVDLGLWAGLTEEQLKTRYARAHKQLAEQPLMVSPPEGEDFSEASARLQAALRKRVKPNGKAIGLVMRPIALALARKLLANESGDRLWTHAQNTDAPLVLQLDPAPARV